ncbi:hypothetical protein T439DRAFT_27473 [Meredithblackwellia eburnea MCA 4105]
MGISPMPWEEWIHLDSSYERYLSIRKERTDQEVTLVNKTIEGFFPHSLEVLVEIASFLSLRYPDLLSVERHIFDEQDETTWGDSISGKEAGSVKIIENKVTGSRWNLDEAGEPGSWDPMVIAGLIVQDDLAVMVENEDGEYVLQAGSICTAGSWRLEDKIGTTLDSIHTTGGVVGWKEKLKFSMERFFQKMKVDKPVQRNNYFFQTNGVLPWNPASGPEDAFDQSLHGVNPELLPTSTDPSWTRPAPVSNATDVWFRTERQTLRRMPKTGCILFTIRSYLDPVSSMVHEPGVPGRMASALKHWPDSIKAYKGADKYLDALLPYLEKEHDRQVAEGIITLDEEGHALGAKPYPF